MRAGGSKCSPQAAILPVNQLVFCRIPPVPARQITVIETQDILTDFRLVYARINFGFSHHTTHSSLPSCASRQAVSALIRGKGRTRSAAAFWFSPFASRACGFHSRQIPFFSPGRKQCRRGNPVFVHAAKNPSKNYARIIFSFLVQPAFLDVRGRRLPHAVKYRPMHREFAQAFRSTIAFKPRRTLNQRVYARIIFGFFPLPPVRQSPGRSRGLPFLWSLFWCLGVTETGYKPCGGLRLVYGFRLVSFLRPNRSGRSFRRGLPANAPGGLIGVGKIYARINFAAFRHLRH